MTEAQKKVREYLAEISEQFFRRFAVAYGLSFDRATLEESRYPEELHVVQSDIRDESRQDRSAAPSKDEV
jgi:hypothetical protein